MHNPVNSTSVPHGGVSICHSSTPPSEAAPLKDKTKAARNRVMAYKTHNSAMESSKEEDDNNSIFCVPPPPTSNIPQ